MEATEARGEWSEMLKVLREKKPYWSIILYTGKLSFKNKGEIKTLEDKWKLKEFIADIPLL